MKHLLIAAALMLAAAPAAQSADLVLKAPPAPVANWSGWYAGLNVGGGLANTDVNYAANDAFTALIVNGFFPILGTGERVRSAGALGGIQAGYNYRFDRKWVVGFEADFQGAGLDSTTVNPVLDGTIFRSASQNIDYFGTVRARLGYLANDKLLVYATGGFAYAHLNNAASIFITSGFFNGGAVGPNGVIYSTNCGLGNPNLCFTGASSGITPGWTAGAGLEYALGGNWSVKGEYLFAQFKETVNVVAVTPSVGTTASSYSANFTTNLNILRIGVNYKFGG